MAQKTRSPSNKIYFTNYKTSKVGEKNKVKKKVRHLSKHPNDIDNNGPVDYRRKKPLTNLEQLILNTKGGNRAKTNART